MNNRNWSVGSSTVSDRVEFWPARAVRWTDSAVLVGVQVIANDWRSTRYLWVAPVDIVRVLRGDPGAGPGTTESGHPGHS